MSNKKIITTKAELAKTLEEEAYKTIKTHRLKQELAELDRQINEVRAGGPMAPGKDGVHAGQLKPVFTKKGTHLTETDDTEETGEMGDTEGMATEPEADTFNADAMMGSAETEDAVASEENAEVPVDKATIVAAIQSLASMIGVDLSSVEGMQMGDDENTPEVEAGDSVMDVPGEETAADIMAADGAEVEADAEVAGEEAADDMVAGDDDNDGDDDTITEKKVGAVTMCEDVQQEPSRTALQESAHQLNNKLAKARERMNFLKNYNK